MIAPMKRGATIILLLTLLTGVVRADLTEQEAGRIAKTVGRIIGQIHYRQIKVNDDISRIHLDNYLNTLDFGHMIFMQSDVDEFKKTYGTRLDDEIKFGKIRPARVIFDKYIERLTQRQKLVDELLKNEMDYTKNERFNPMRNKLPWPKTQPEVEDLWRARIKYELLADKLTLSKDGEIPDAKKLKDSKAKIGRRYERLLKTMKGYERDDILETYLSALTRAYDPHSDYMSPHEAENFKINSIDMQLTGIGAVLRVDDGYTTIVRIMPGGPAGRSKLLHANDKIIAVQNPGDKAPTDVIDMKIDKVVQLIRGKKGSDVKLTIIPAGTEERKVITITRDVVKLEDQLAKAYIIEQKRDGKSEKLGLINLPGFYSKCSNHCRTLIERLKKEGVDGIVLDLRHNGGGILQEAINLTGLFIEEGPVVQVKDYRGRRRVMSDKKPQVTYSGPLIVAVSHMSASASEIVAAALQDHGRAIVVGGKMTHGKGTVQQILPLNRAFIANLDKDSGQLKFTISKFYRINGATTQRDGVKPDIILPSVFDYLGMSEAELPRALESDEIEKAKYKPLDRVEAFFTSLRYASTKRIKEEQDYKYIMEDIARARKQKEDRSVSLNENERRKERADNKTRIEARNKERADRAVRSEKYFEIDVKTAEAGKPLKKLDAPKPKKENPDPNAIPEDDSNTFNLDPELRETLQILSDFVKLNSKLISQIKKN
uniref:Periplasmic protease n=1 Tax=uncultured verrucomicrobium HF0500_16O23 TaxID=723598 RepID=E7C573_9BACT|nr:periplasmic protease [uncultured verrucomicrobium HF0500_16O23]